MEQPDAKKQRTEASVAPAPLRTPFKPTTFSLLLLQPQPSPRNTTFKALRVHNWSNAATWRDVLPQLYDFRLYALRNDFTTRVDSNGDTLVEFEGTTPDEFDKYIVRTVPFYKPIPDDPDSKITGTYHSFSPPLYSQHKVENLPDSEFTAHAGAPPPPLPPLPLLPLSFTPLAQPSSSRASSTASRATLVQREPSTRPFNAPFPSSQTIPARFMFLMHASPNDPRTWTQRAVQTKDIDVGNRALGLQEYPGAYFTLVTQDNVHSLTPYKCGSGCYVGVFALDLLKQRNWHINFEDVHGQISSSLTCFPWQLDTIAELIQRSSFNEVVFHDPVPLDPFMTRAFKVTAKESMRYGKSSDFAAQAVAVGRVELHADGSLLNAALPQYCWPSFFEVEEEDLAFERDPRWTRAIADACGLDWDATLRANETWMASADKIEEKRAFRGPLLAQAATVSVYGSRAMQTLDALHQLSLEPQRFQGYLDGGGGFFGVIE